MMTALPLTSSAQTIAINGETWLDAYQFLLQPFTAAKGLLLQIQRAQQKILAVHLPSIFSLGEIRALKLHMRGQEYLFLSANSAPRISGKCWFGLFYANGKKVYVASFECNLSSVAAHDDALLLQFSDGGSQRVKLAI